VGDEAGGDFDSGKLQDTASKKQRFFIFWVRGSTKVLPMKKRTETIKQEFLGPGIEH
jgi:hypothetical protein